MSNLPPAPRQWLRSPKAGEDAQFLVSMDKSLISLTKINEEFEKDYIYWAKSLPEAELKTAVDSSLCFGLYKCIQDQVPTDGRNQPTTWSSSQVEQIGFARLITDNVTFFYLADVFVMPEYQGAGLGTFMVRCIKEVVDGMQHLRRLLIMTGDKNTIGYYEKLMDVKVLGEIGNAYILGRKGPGSCV
ncbi:uncharacterized protein GIQ15_00547 [Arthroderma uncinatum]|uniref:uncharacterized protein n=1 Tax=Arthroderma uncinatum TaxID=74035 RepID=UPI00144AF93D|nr:uncharacterized protein GIQ15_00547 [Arthroderma uncinatum]KAF3491030.1 hypothetical protein GIQ15_00547 [Arthroderma uncinatum]